MLRYCLTSRINLQLQKLCKGRCAKAVNAYQKVCLVQAPAYCAITFGPDKKLSKKHAAATLQQLSSAIHIDRRLL